MIDILFDQSLCVPSTKTAIQEQNYQETFYNSIILIQKWRLQINVTFENIQILQYIIESLTMCKHKTNKTQYKQHKRKTRNRLISLLALHTVFMFAFASLVCFKYLEIGEWRTSLYLALVSDVLYLGYAILGMLAIKLKNWAMLIVMMVVLASSVSAEIGSFIFILNNSQQLTVIHYINITLLILSYIVPIFLVKLWDQLKDSKWRETFDMHAKQTSYLIEEGVYNKM